MQELLLNPAIVSGVLPAVAAALAWAVLGRTRALVLVLLAGLATVTAAGVGFTLEPMTARSKLVIGLAAAGLLALVLDALRAEAGDAARGWLALLAAAAALWIAARVLAQRETQAATLLVLGVGAWAAAMVAGTLAARLDTLRSLVAAAVLGFAGGALGLLGASASVAMLGIAIGASCGVALLGFVIRGGAMPALSFVALPAAAYAALGGEVASLTGQLPWFALLPLALVPWAARAAPRRELSLPADAALAGIAAAIPAAAAVALAVWGATPA